MRAAIASEPRSRATASSPSRAMLTVWRSVLLSSAMLTVGSAARKPGGRATRSRRPAEDVFDRTREGKQFGIRAAAREQLQSHRQRSGEVLDRQGDAAEPEQV